ncbi:hypothetical protein ABIE62_000492 [Porphyrobacter sp. MBR-155]|jgi:hypothetical protein|uniref:hypothetical protein n=1 Tax=Porphyrobacter sp. MBR-155 TaxID=3156464 RepID=UPI00339A9575
MKKALFSLTLLCFAWLPTHANAQTSEQASGEVEDEITVVGQKKREAVETLGKAITRPSRRGLPVGRFDAPICVKVSGLPADMAEIIKARIEENIGDLKVIEVAEAGCDPNAFVGFLDEVDATVDQLREKEKWLFEGLLDYQIDRIYKGSDGVRAWHVFDLRNLDGSIIPATRKGGGGTSDHNDAVNRVESASRFVRLRNNLVGAVVLIEGSAIEGKTFRQLSDYATMRLLASTNDDVNDDNASLPTILTLFNGQYAPDSLTEFDRAYLSALYELPANSMDGQIFAAAASRYVNNQETATNE